MKLMVNKKNRVFSIYLLLVAMLGIFIMPLYFSSFHMIRENISQEVRSKLQVGLEKLDAEIINMNRICVQVVGNDYYLKIQSLTGLDTPSSYILLREFYTMYQNLVSMNNSMSEAVILFRDNPISVFKDQQLDNSSGYFNYYFNFKNMNYEQFKEYVLSQKQKMWMEYDDTLTMQNKETPAIVFFFPVKQNLLKKAGAVITCVYPIEELMKQMWGDNYKDMSDVMILNSSREVLFRKGNVDLNMSDKNVIWSESRETGLIFCGRVSEKYFFGKMINFQSLMIIYAILLLLGVLIFEGVLRYIQDKPLKNLIRLVESMTGEKDMNNLGYNYIYQSVQKLKNKNVYLNDEISKFIFKLLFLHKMSAEEKQLFTEKYPDFPLPCIFVIFSGKHITSDVINLILNKYDIKSGIMVNDNEDNIVLFLPYNDKEDYELELKEALNKIIDDFKKHNIELSISISIVCNSVYEIYDVYQHMIDRFRYADYSQIIDVSQPVDQNAEINHLDISIINKIYELILQGNAFEAKKNVYKQWYDLIQHPYFNNQIEQVFFQQNGILSSVALKVKYMGEMPVYDSKKTINELAFMIAEVIDDMCDFITKNTEAKSQYKEIIQYIDDNFTVTNFGLVDLVDKFNLSGKTINNIVKQCTGSTFTEYVMNHRIRLAKQLLSDSTTVISQISEECGFNTYDAFYKFFKKKEKVSPVEYRSIYGNGR